MGTRVINAYDRYVFDVEIPDERPKRGLIFRNPEMRDEKKAKKEKKKQVAREAEEKMQELMGRGRKSDDQQ